MTDLYVRSPRQASDIYGLDGTTIARAKNLFFVRFRRTDNGQSSGDWQNNLGFIVKTLDRPSVTPTIEEVNQYNKRRQITTGFKIQPMRMVLYDTVDNLAMRMWDEYSRYYFGDFSQDSDAMFRYDTTMASMQDNGSGFGYVPRPGDGITDLNSQFFFDALEVYQVFGGQFTQFDLINPKINQFDPDELDYSSNDPGTISLQLTYEAIQYRNNGRPTAISENERVSAAFNGKFNGGTFEPEGVLPRGTSLNTGSQTPSYILAPKTGTAPAKKLRENPDAKSTGGGALSMFGNYNFGSVSGALGAARQVRNAVNGGDISYLASGNPQLATALSLGRQLGGLGSISANNLDSVIGAVEQVSKNEQAKDFVKNNLLSGILGSAATAPAGTSKTPGEQVTTANGLGLNSQSLAIINAQRPSSSQIGFNGLDGLF